MCACVCVSVSFKSIIGELYRASYYCAIKSQVVFMNRDMVNMQLRHSSSVVLNKCILPQSFYKMALTNEFDSSSFFTDFCSVLAILFKGHAV